MAFASGTVKEVEPGRKWHVTNVQLDQGAVATITLTDKSAPGGDNLSLMTGESTFYNDPSKSGMTLADTVQVSIYAAGTITSPPMVSWTATPSATPPRLILTFTNDDGVNATPPLGIWITAN